MLFPKSVSTEGQTKFQRTSIELQMKFQEGFFYHVYNQSNRKETIFRDIEDYLYFLGRIKKWVYPVGSILAYCIMPNHFHFLIEANIHSVEQRKLGALSTNELSNGFRIVQSQYAQFYNKKYASVGSVFRPKVKAKSLHDSNGDYLTDCFNYIHQNPLKAKLCTDLSGWEFSSARDYLDLRGSKLVDIGKAKDHILIDWSDFRNESDRPILENKSKYLFL